MINTINGSKVEPDSGAKSCFLTLHTTCSETLEKSFEGDAGQKMSLSYMFVSDLQTWTQLLVNKPESKLYQVAEQEYMTALLSLTHGQYRNAFKGLRLVLELTIQGIYLSSNLVELNEWLRGVRDTKWAILIGSPQEPGTEESAASERGPFTKRFCDAFFPELRGYAPTFATMARTLYRELSETIHGNVPREIPVSPSLEFDQDTFDLWHKKAESVRLIGLFCLTCRYAALMEESERAAIESGVVEQLGHIEPIRILFGGPTTS